MHAEDRVLSIVFEPSIRLTVPLFQRPYVWTQDQNWEPLWESFHAALDRRLRGDKPRPHFLGAIVLAQMDTPTGEVGERQVIDGQQRLTTLQLFIAAIRDLAGARAVANYKEAFKRFAQNFVPSSRDEDSIFKVWPTNVDRTHFRATMLAGSPEFLADRYDATSTGESLGHLIPDCYLYFYKRMAESLKASAPADLEKWFEAVFATIRQDLVLVVVDLDKNDDPQLIFETLNALGTPLLPSDLVKNFLFHQALQQNEDVESLHQEYWSPFIDDADYWRAEIRQGRLKWHRIDIFLAHYLTLQRKEVVSMTHLFGEFRDHFRSREVVAREHITALYTYGQVFKRFDEYHPDSREGVFFRRLEDLDTNMVLPVLLEVLRSPQPREETIRFLDLLESYLVRRAVCGLTYKNYNRLFVDLIRRLSQTSFCSNELCKYLLERDGDSAVWPTDKEFQDAFMYSTVYKGLKQSRVRMVLEAVEQSMRDGKAEKIRIDEKLTIEHVMPRSWEEHWPLVEPVGDNPTEVRNQLVHTFGNLSLVTAKLNPSLSNSAWKTKRAALLQHSALALNRSLQQFETWDERAILKRGLQMFAVAKALWPRPAG